MLGGRAGSRRRGLGALGRSPPALPVVLDARRRRRAPSERERARVLQPTRHGLRATDWLRARPRSRGEPRGVAPRCPRWPTARGVGTREARCARRAAGDRATAHRCWSAQRYGRGTSRRCIATGGTWRWQMGMPARRISSHERFWQSGCVGDPRRQRAAGARGGARRRPGGACATLGATTVITVDARDADWAPLGARGDGSQSARDHSGRHARGGSSSWPTPARAGRWTGTGLAARRGRARGASRRSRRSRAASRRPGSRCASSAWTCCTSQRHRRGVRRAPAAWGLLERVAARSPAVRYLHARRRSTGCRTALAIEQRAALTRSRDRLALWNMPALFLLILLAKGLPNGLLRLRWRRL